MQSIHPFRHSFLGKVIFFLFLIFFSSTECEVLHGDCIQTYVPYLFLVIPLGPVTLTGQVGKQVQSTDGDFLFRITCSWSLVVHAGQSMPHLARTQILRISFQILARTELDVNLFRKIHAEDYVMLFFLLQKH